MICLSVIDSVPSAARPFQCQDHMGFTAVTKQQALKLDCGGPPSRVQFTTVLVPPGPLPVWSSFQVSLSFSTGKPVEVFICIAINLLINERTIGTITNWVFWSRYMMYLTIYVGLFHFLQQYSVVFRMWAQHIFGHFCFYVFVMLSIMDIKIHFPVAFCWHIMNYAYWPFIVCLWQIHSEF